jgi:hypothetical protein
MDYDRAAEIINIYLSSFSEKNKFLKYIGEGDTENISGEDVPVSFIRDTLEKISSTDSIFSIQLLMEYLYLDNDILKNFSGEGFRINSPGTVSGDNWSMVIPVSMEELGEMKINKLIKELNFKSGRTS